VQGHPPIGRSYPIWSHPIVHLRQQDRIPKPVQYLTQAATARTATLDAAPAPWRSGYAAACKAVYTSSILVGASTGLAGCAAAGGLHRPIRTLLDSLGRPSLALTEAITTSAPRRRSDTATEISPCACPIRA
jgi:hypothetical protein